MASGRQTVRFKPGRRGFRSTEPPFPGRTPEHDQMFREVYRRNTDAETVVERIVEEGPPPVPPPPGPGTVKLAPGLPVRLAHSIVRFDRGWERDGPDGTGGIDPVAMVFLRAPWAVLSIEARIRTSFQSVNDGAFPNLRIVFGVELEETLLNTDRGKAEYFARSKDPINQQLRTESRTSVPGYSILLELTQRRFMPPNFVTPWQRVGAIHEENATFLAGYMDDEADGGFPLIPWNPEEQGSMEVLVSYVSNIPDVGEVDFDQIPGRNIMQLEPVT